MAGRRHRSRPHAGDAPRSPRAPIPSGVAPAERPPIPPSSSVRSAAPLSRNPLSVGLLPRRPPPTRPRPRHRPRPVELRLRQPQSPASTPIRSPHTRARRRSATAGSPPSIGPPRRRPPLSDGDLLRRPLFSPLADPHPILPPMTPFAVATPEPQRPLSPSLLFCRSPTVAAPDADSSPFPDFPSSSSTAPRPSAAVNTPEPSRHHLSASSPPPRPPVDPG